MTYTTDILVGLAQLLDGAGLAVYRDSVPYQAGERGIYFAHTPPASSTTRRESVTLTPYDTERLGLAVEVTRVQIRAHLVDVAPLDAIAWQDSVKGLFPENKRHTIGGHEIDAAQIISSPMWGEPDRPDQLVAIVNVALRGNRYAA